MISKILRLLTARERVALLGLVVASLLMGALQVAGVGSVMPVLALMAKPGIAHENPILSWAFVTFGFASTQSFLYFVGAVALGSIILSNAFIAFTTWLMIRYSWGVHARISVTLLDSYLAKPYEEFLIRNSADLRKNVLQEVGRFTSGVLSPLLSLVGFGTVVLFLVTFLIWLNPLIAAVAVVVLGGGYVLLFVGVRRALTSSGEARSAADSQRFKIVGESLDGIKETKVLGREATYVSLLRRPAQVLARTSTTQQVLGQMPRFAIEALAFGSILLAVLFFMSSGADLEGVVVVVGVYAFAGYRLLPAVQNIYQSWSTIRFNQTALNSIHNEYAERAPSDSTVDADDRLAFRESLELDQINFTYPNALSPALKDVSITIRKGSSVAFIGETGGGKTTLADVILGLLRPRQGRLSVDGVALNTPVVIRRWQRNLGYVPQEIYLTDDSVAANIAFGVPPGDIDPAAVERAARIANIHSFIVQELPHGYSTVVGERGVRLSGGQRQRIGIARALYRDPPVLVLDEATSDLDVATEAAVQDAITSASRERTVIMIAHRLSTTRNCDVLYVIEQGRIVRQGTYEQVVDENGLMKVTSQGSALARGS